MALARVKTWVSGEVLLASDLNSEFNNLLNNALTLIAPLTASLNAGGFKITNYGGTDAPTSVTDVALNAFVQGGTGAATQTLQNRMRLEVWAEDFGAVGDGVTNDTTAINAAITQVAIAGGTVRLASKDYKVTSLVLKPGVTLVGKGGQKLSGLHGTRLIGTAGSDIITFPSGNVSDVGVIGMELSGGRRSIAYDGGGYIAEFQLEDLRFSAPSDECIYIQGQSERQLFRYLHFSQGTYGYYHGKGALTHGIHEKSIWEHLYFETQSIHGIFWDDISVSGSLSATFVKVISSGQHGVHVKGNFDGMTWIGWNFESNGTTGASATTTGTINSASNSLVVASATGFTNGDPITVAGAGTTGEDLTTTVTNIAGTTFTLTDNAGTSVTAAATTNRSYDDIYLESASGVSGASNLNLIGCYPGAGNGAGKIRYGLNNVAGWCKNITLIGCSGVSTAPVYDPKRRVTLINSTTGVRQPTGFGNDRFNVMTLPGVANLAGASPESRRTLIPSPSGKDLILGLADSVGNGTGTLGNASVYASYGSPTEIFRIEGTLPTDGKTCAYVLRNVAGVFSLQQMTMGIADSGGAGFKLLRVPN